MQLHRTSGKPDWKSVAPGRRNRWQRAGSATHSVVTPGNIATAVGFVLVLYGLWQLLHHHYIVGGVALAIGRGLDVVDGWLAESTGTKSPLGELLDASIDKVGTILTIIVFFAAGLAPWWALVALLTPHVIISLITFVLLQKGRRLHPTREGKLSMATAWVSLVGFIVARASGQNIFDVFASVIATISVALGLYAAYSYLRQRLD
jgi:phosphatidylglycerophosphate synthase